LLDEPSTGLDPLARRELGDYLEELRKKDGMTALLTTHIMEEADRCDRLAIIDRGRLVAVDTPHALKERVGGDVITVGSIHPAELKVQIEKRFGVKTSMVETPSASSGLADMNLFRTLVEAFPGEIDSVSVGQTNVGRRVHSSDRTPVRGAA